MLFTVILLIFSMEHFLWELYAWQSFPLNVWQMKVKTGLESNPSWLFVSFGHRENWCDPACFRGKRGLGGWGGGWERWEVRRTLFFFEGCPVMRACNKARVFIVNRSLQLRGSLLQMPTLDLLNVNIAAFSKCSVRYSRVKICSR